MKPNSHPPKFWTQLFKWLCNDSYYEELQGDLEERFFINQETDGLKKAKAVYRKEVLKMMRPSVLKLKNRLPSLFQISLFRVHLILSLRNLKRNKVFSAINILGLGAALSVCLFVVNMLYTGLLHDNQHPEGDRLYRITTTKLSIGRQPFLTASSPRELEEVFASSLPEAELSTVVEDGPGFQFPFGSTPFSGNSILVDSAFFQLFTFKVIEGYPEQIFDDLNSIVITQEVAQKIYPNESALGKETIQGYVVKAVIETPRTKSHMDFQIIGNVAINTLSNNQKSTQNKAWDINYGTYIYIRLNEEVSTSQLNQKLEKLSDQVNNELKREDSSLHFKSQLVRNITFGEFHWLDFDYVLDRR
ncbi:MAG: putative ABC transport system permease protein, partial [Roseivirga sp.]